MPGELLIISFYTIGDKYYERSAARFKEQCAGLGLTCYVEGIEKIGEWIDCTRLKGQFIDKCMKRFDRPLLWVDIDGSVMKKPHGFNADVAARLHNKINKRKYRVGTLFFNNTKGGKRFLEQFAKECAKCQNDFSDEHCFQLAYAELKDITKIEALPLEYFMSDKQPGTVIMHRSSGNVDLWINRRKAHK